MGASAATTVAVRVLLFASYADAVGRGSLEVVLEAPATVASLLRHLRTQPGGDRLPAHPLVAVNLIHATADTRLSDNDEVALLPPLAGG